MKSDLPTNATVVDDVIRFVSHQSKEKLKSSLVIVMKIIKKSQMNLIMMKSS
jgi:hypothetical protein